jgi:hypothetical protein
MALLFTEKHISNCAPSVIFERLQKYSNINLNGFEKSDPDKIFFVNSETDKYYIHRRNKLVWPSFLKRINFPMSAELKLTKIESNKTEISYIIKGESKFYHDLLFYFILALGIPFIIFADSIFEKINLLIGITGLFFYRRYKNKVLIEYKKEYLDLYKNIK